jgi:hypothetical protein
VDHLHHSLIANTKESATGLHGQHPVRRYAEYGFVMAEGVAVSATRIESIMKAAIEAGVFEAEKAHLKLWSAAKFDEKNRRRSANVLKVLAENDRVCKSILR